MLRRLVPALCLLALPLATPGANWPGWRGPDSTGVTAEKNLPVKWSAAHNVRWKVPVTGAGVSAPAVWDDHIFLTASDGRLNDRLHVFCYHRADGRLWWHSKFFGSALPEGQFAPGGMAVPTAATDGKHVIALFGTGDLVCLDFEGKPVWLRSLAQEYGPFRNRWGMAASPLLLDKLLVVQVDHFGQSYLLGVDVDTGATRWKTERDATVNWSSPVAAQVQGKKQIITAGTYKVKGYDAETGAEVWSVTGVQMQCIPTPVVHGDMAYVVSGRDHYSLAIRLDSARGDLTETHVKWKTPSGAAYTTSPVYYGGHYFYVEDTGWGNCLDAATGEVLWRQRMGGKYHASLLAGDGKVYFTSLEGVVTVIKAGAKFELLAKNDLGEGIVATPAVSNGQLFIRGEKHLFCIAEK
jgi:outer membrane protein assembly factor BamB